CLVEASSKRSYRPDARHATVDGRRCCTCELIARQIHRRHYAPEVEKPPISVRRNAAPKRWGKPRQHLSRGCLPPSIPEQSPPAPVRCSGVSRGSHCLLPTIVGEPDFLRKLPE